MKKLLTYLLLIFLISGFTSKNELVELTNNQHVKVIPFNFDYGIPIIKATINDREYNFLFDTGMLTALSESIVKELNLKSIRSEMRSDANGNTKQISFVLVDKISIGGISFKKVETFSTDLNSSFTFGCMNLDGLIGSNLIKDAIWEIDYENKVIRLTDNIDNLKIPESADIIKFKTYEKEGSYSPFINISVNKKKIKGVLFDTGSGGGIKLHLAHFARIPFAYDERVEYYGKAGVSLFGMGENKEYVDSKMRSIEIGTLKLQNQIVSFDENFAMIGNRLFQNFKIIINYDENRIYMIKQKDYNNSLLETFGFIVYVNDDQKAIITVIYKNSNAEKKGLQLGDEIITVNDLNIRELIMKDACVFLRNNPIKEMKDSINITYSRNGKEHSLQLEKETLID